MPQNVNFAIKASIARAFLDAHAVQVKTAPTAAKLKTADIAARARSFTVVVECWK